MENEGWETPVWGVGDPCVGWEPTLWGMGGVGDLLVEDGGWETSPMKDAEGGRPLWGMGVWETPLWGVGDPSDGGGGAGRPLCIRWGWETPL